MSVVKVNAMEVPPGAGPELEKRFAARAGAVENSPGFEAFQLLRPTEGETRYFVMTWWDSEESFQNWMNSQDFAKGHADAGPSGDQPNPVSTGSSMLSFEVVEQIPPAGA